MLVCVVAAASVRLANQRLRQLGPPTVFSSPSLCILLQCSLVARPEPITLDDDENFFKIIMVSPTRYCPPKFWANSSAGCHQTASRSKLVAIIIPDDPAHTLMRTVAGRMCQELAASCSTLGLATSWLAGSRFALRCLSLPLRWRSTKLVFGHASEPA